MTTTSRSTTESPEPHWPRWHPLSDHLRWVKVALLLTLLALGLVHLGWLFHGEQIDPSIALADPQRHAGVEVALPMMRVVEVQGDRARLWAPWIEVVAAPVTADAVAGATISLRGHIAPDGTVAVDAMTVHERHGIKKAIGIGITMVVVVLVGWDLRAGRRRRA